MNIPDINHSQMSQVCRRIEKETWKFHLIKKNDEIRKVASVVKGNCNFFQQKNVTFKISFSLRARARHARRECARREREARSTGLKITYSQDSNLLQIHTQPPTSNWTGIFLTVRIN